MTATKLFGFAVIAILVAIPALCADTTVTLLFDDGSERLVMDGMDEGKVYEFPGLPGVPTTTKARNFPFQPGIFPAGGVRIVVDGEMQFPLQEVDWLRDGRKVAKPLGDWRLIYEGTGSCRDPYRPVNGKGWLVAVVFNENDPDLMWTDKFHVEVKTLEPPVRAFAPVPGTEWVHDLVAKAIVNHQTKVETVVNGMPVDPEYIRQVLGAGWDDMGMSMSKAYVAFLDGRVRALDAQSSIRLATAEEQERFTEGVRTPHQERLILAKNGREIGMIILPVREIIYVELK